MSATLPPSRGYDPFAAFYDRYWGAAYLSDVQEGFSEVFLPLLEPGAKILDLCCGSGRMAEWLTACGFRVTGVDCSEAMLDEARRIAPGAAFVQADVCKLEPPDVFDAVISTFDSLNHLPALADLQTAFNGAFAALRPGGMFFFDMNLEEGFLEAARETYSGEDDEHLCLVRSAWDEVARSGVSKVTLFEREGELWQRSDAEIVEFCYSQEQIETALAQARFDKPEVLAGTEDLAMPRGEGRVFFLTRRPELA